MKHLGLNAFVVDAIRTPRGSARGGGSLAKVKPIDLLRTLFREIENRFEGISAHVEDVVLGCVTAVGEQGANLAKIAALHAQWPETISGVTLNRFCASGLEAVIGAALKTHAGMEGLILAGGVESITRVPMFKDEGSWFQDPDVARSTRFIHMGLAADLLADLNGIDRRSCDDWAYASHQRATAAEARRAFARSMVPVRDEQGTTILDRDEWVRPTLSRPSLDTLLPAFSELVTAEALARIRTRYPHIHSLQSVHTAGSSPGRVDGAALVLMAHAGMLQTLSLKPRARIRAYANASVDPLVMLTGGALAAARALERAELKAHDIDLWEINESFSATVLDAIRRLHLNPDRVNVNGGAIALGHPLGASGAVLLATLLDELEHRDQRFGCIAISAGAGIGQALIVERI